MKKIFGFLIMLGIICNVSLADTVIYEKPDVKIIVEGKNLELGENVPIIVNSRTLVPLRKLLVGLGVPDNTTNIQWIPEKMAVKVEYNGVIIDLAIGSYDGYINGIKYALDSAPIIHKDRTYLPAKFVGEALGYSLGWDPNTPAVIVTSNNNMTLLTNILNDLNTAMNNLESYETISKKSTKMISRYNDNIDIVEAQTTKLEQADLVKKIMYSETEYSDQNQKNFTFEYGTDEVLYSCYKYEEGGVLYNSGWKKYLYNARTDEKTPYELKEKSGLIKIDESVYPTLAIMELDNEYIIYTPTSQIDVLKVMDLDGLYKNATAVYNDVEKFSFIMSLDKESSLPKYLSVKMTTKSQETTRDENAVEISEEINYEITFNKYNQYLELVLPEA